MAGTMGGVPASNLAGNSAGSKLLHAYSTNHAAAAQKRRHRIEQDSRPYSTPTPEGPSILWPLRRQKIGVPTLHVQGSCGTPCAASTSTVTPAGVRGGDDLARSD